MTKRAKQSEPVKQAAHIQARLDRIAAGTEPASPVGYLKRGLRHPRKRYSYRRRHRY